MADSFNAWTVPFGAGLAAAVICAILIVVLRPLLARYALARPNARSSHEMPTPQGGGIAVIAATMIAVAGAVIIAPSFLDDPYRLTIMFGAVLVLGIVGVTDDVRPLDVFPRLALQAAAVAVVAAWLPPGLRILPMLPWWTEYACLVLGGIWLVNLVNFMDGIDWMTVAEVVPITAALAAFGLTGALPPAATVVSIALCGAMIGFAPFNRPVASLFLGDVGSLPIGLLLFWLLALLAGGGHLIAALLLPLYYVADATITLLRRLTRGESVTVAHRGHFYQQALEKGFCVGQIVSRVFAVNVLLIGLAVISLLASVALQIAALFAGCALVSALLWTFNCGRVKTLPRRSARL